MQELRFVAVSEDGSYAVLAVPGRSARFILPIDERLRAVALGQTSRLAQYEIEVESPLRPKEIQARIRAGETAEEIADAAGIPVERVRWFEGPVLAERAYIAQQAQTATVRRQGDSAGPGPRLEDIVAERVAASGGDPEEGEWDSRKRGDGTWQVQLTYSAGGRLHIAEWVFDPRRRHVMPDDDTAARLSLPESELPPPPESMPGEATVTPIASRLAAGMSPGPSVSRFRPEPPPYPDPAPERPRAPEHTRAPDRARPPEPAQPPQRPAPARPASYAQPPSQHESERMVPTPPSHPSDGRRAGAPWSDSARYAETDGYAPEPVSAPQPEFPQPEFPQPEFPQPEFTARPEPEFLTDPGPALEAELAPAPAPAPAPEPEAAPTPAPATEPEPAPRAKPTRSAEPPASAEAARAAAAPKKPVAAPAKKEPARKEPAAKKKAAPGKKDSPAATPAAASPGKPAEARNPDAVATGTAATDTGARDTAAREEKPAPEEQRPARPRPAKKNPRNRRSSVPSWDEIMLGSSRQPD